MVQLEACRTNLALIRHLRLYSLCGLPPLQRCITARTLLLPLRLIDVVVKRGHAKSFKHVAKPFCHYHNRIGREFVRRNMLSVGMVGFDPGGINHHDAEKTLLVEVLMSFFGHFHNFARTEYGLHLHLCIHPCWAASTFVEGHHSLDSRLVPPRIEMTDRPLIFPLLSFGSGDSNVGDRRDLHKARAVPRSLGGKQSSSTRRPVLPHSEGVRVREIRYSSWHYLAVVRRTFLGVSVETECAEFFDGRDGCLPGSLRHDFLCIVDALVDAVTDSLHESRLASKNGVVHDNQRGQVAKDVRNDLYMDSAGRLPALFLGAEGDKVLVHQILH
mmetsp:Transcript_39155/g.77009  ORF Transcript_39155/g.77009 Transcript_39155/m.77009 type:complete len:329 (+) Transcript_39155:61-1047(+)